MSLMLPVVVGGEALKTLKLPVVDDSEVLLVVKVVTEAASRVNSFRGRNGLTLSPVFFAPAGRSRTRSSRPVESLSDRPPFQRQTSSTSTQHRQKVSRPPQITDRLTAFFPSPSIVFLPSIFTHRAKRCTHSEECPSTGDRQFRRDRRNGPVSTTPRKPHVTPRQFYSTLAPTTTVTTAN